jgi:hypothetical protein
MVSSKPMGSAPLTMARIASKQETITQHSGEVGNRPSNGGPQQPGLRYPGYGHELIRGR